MAIEYGQHGEVTGEKEIMQYSVDYVATKKPIILQVERSTYSDRWL